MKRVTFFAYGVACHALFLAVYGYMAGFVLNVGVPKGIDSPRDGSLWAAILIDVALLTMFAVQHSVMARPAFKQWWTRFIPQPIERSTYVLFSNIAVITLMWLWRPIGGEIWNVENPIGRNVLYAVAAFGWLMVPVVTLLINHFDLFGTRQVWLYLRGKEYTYLPFRTPLIYKRIRHPLYVGWMIAFWATPTMTAAHFTFALLLTAYMLIAIRFEERDLVTHHGRTYAEYRKRVPMLIPRPKTGVRDVSEVLEPTTVATTA